MNHSELLTEVATPLIQLRMQPPARTASCVFLFRKKAGGPITEDSLQPDIPLMDEMIRLRLTVPEALTFPDDPRSVALRAWLTLRLEASKPTEQGHDDSSSELSPVA